MQRHPARSIGSGADPDEDIPPKPQKICSHPRLYRAFCSLSDTCGSGFGGHSDWRFPTLDELRTIIRHDQEHPATVDEFDDSCVEGCAVTACSCTSSGDHGTSTAYAYFVSDYARVINFFDGQSSADANWTMNFVRLVRDAN